MSLTLDTAAQEKREQIKLRKQLVLGALFDGKSKSFEEAISKAEMVYKWIMEGTR